MSTIDTKIHQAVCTDFLYSVDNPEHNQTTNLLLCDMADVVMREQY
jgi:hypothetical protein